MSPPLSGIGSALGTLGAMADERSDERLLDDYFTRRDESAFATLVRRHHRTVWLASARVLTDPADRDDVFQATFLILAQSGQMLADRGGVGGWLYRVADRVARKARIMAIRRRRREAAARPTTNEDTRTDHDLLEILGDEVNQLPDRYRLAVLACDFDGLERAEAARRLGCAEGTLSARLHRGRKQLAARLRARGITAPLAGLAGVLTVSGWASAKLIAATLRAAREVTEHGLANRAVSAAVAALVTHTTRDLAMTMTTKALATVTLLAAVLVGGWFGLPDGTTPRATAAPVPEANKSKVPEVPPSAFQLLRSRKVHRELKCTSDQRVTIADHFDDQFETAANRPPLMVFAPGQPRNPQAEKEQIEAKVKELQDAEAADTKAMAEKTLNPAQLTRLVQIELQIKGAEALLDTKVADALKLTDEQKKAIGEAIDAAHRGGGIAAGGLNTGGPVQSGAIRYWHLDPEQRKAAFAEAEKGLTKDQIAEWKRLIGEKVTAFDPYTIGGRGGSVNSGVQFRGGIRP